MIHIDRNLISLPEIFYTEKIDIARSRLKEFYISEMDRSQRRFSKPFDNVIAKELKSSLKELFKHKCAYCESLIPPAAASGDIDNFRPKSGARGLEKDFAVEHYWWLTYEWGNLYYSCQLCSRYKSSWFPVEGPRIDVFTPYEETILKESALLIDPCNDRPEEHLVYDEEGKVDFVTSKGKITIEILKLNRQELIDARKHKLNELRAEWDSFVKLFRREKTNRRKLKKMAEDWELLFLQTSENAYLGFQRQMLSKWITNRSDIQDYLSNKMYEQFETEKSVAAERTFHSFENIQIIQQLDEDEKKIIEERLNINQLKHIYIEKIEIKNFKCFSDIEIDFKGGKIEDFITDREMPEKASEPWLLFLGENGVGKSSLLKALVIGLCGSEYLKKLDLRGADILKYGATSGYVKISLVGEEQQIGVTFNESEIIASTNLPVVNLVAYNSMRLRPIKRKLIPETKTFKNVKVKNLFDYSASLIDADAWLLNRNQEVFDRVCLTLKDLMMLDEKDKIEVFEKKIFVKKEDGQRIVINDLSDGYQSIYLLAVDIMEAFVGEMASFDLVEGMVVIDEIGTHLHPRWRMEVVEKLRRSFPKIQFVVTTHEPLCLRGLNAGETVVLTRDSEKKIIALTDLPNPSELRVDQILTSDFFGLKSTIDPNTEKLFDEYYELLAIDDNEKTEEQKNRLLILSGIIPKIKHLGDNLRDEIIYYVVDELLAKKVRNEGLKLTQDIKEEAIKRVDSLWKLIDSQRL